MAGKPLTRASRRCARIVDSLSKNTLADIVVDRILAEIGNDSTDKEILMKLQEWLHPIAILRQDKEVNLLSALQRLDDSEEAYRKKSLGDLAASGGIVDAP